MTVLADNLVWLTARAGGIVALALLTACVLAGVVLAGRARLERWPRFAVESVHRFAGTAAWAFIGIHVVVLLFDEFAPFSVADLLVPGHSGYRTVATAAGIVALELLTALAIANRLKTRLPYRLWRRTHYLNFAVWALAIGHGIAAGTDSGTAWATALYGACAASVAGAVAWRALAARERRSPTAAQPAGR
ncbi:MAG: ferric reductase-like transmembrane domain-containing protein [Thermoleophilia bacterium]